jgi:hypothetical protein
LTFAGATGLFLVFNWAGGTVDWSDAFWNVNQSWGIIGVQGDITGFENLYIYPHDMVDSNGIPFSSLGASFHLSLSGSTIYLNYTAAIPEPSTYGLALGGLALAFAAYRRRNKSSK